MGGGHARSPHQEHPPHLGHKGQVLFLQAFRLRPGLAQVCTFPQAFTLGSKPDLLIVHVQSLRGSAPVPIAVCHHRKLLIGKGLPVIIGDCKHALFVFAHAAGYVQAGGLSVADGDGDRKGLTQVLHGDMIDQTDPLPLCRIETVGAADIGSAIQHILLLPGIQKACHISAPGNGQIIIPVS